MVQRMEIKKMNRLILELKALENPEKKKILQRFFKTGTGEYGEGDVFLGVTVPETRRVTKRFNSLMLKDIQGLLLNKYHEVRLAGFLILIDKYESAKKKKEFSEQKRIVDFYLKNIENANNWDLVDLSCYKILGDYLINKKNERMILYELIKSKNLWKRRVGMVSTMALIRNNDLDDVFSLSEHLFQDKEDLMHKAVGWMLREAGKRDEARLKDFLKKNVKKMPRTTLRYSIEKFSERDRQYYLKL
jgi:3-methyladenine DNA glycosylase AlkD